MTTINTTINIVYCFIGSLPHYSIDTVYQTRLFYDGPIYFIISDYESPYVKKLLEYNVSIVRYDDVRHNDFETCIKNNYHKFTILSELKGREKLFIYAFERFFVLYHLMIGYNVCNVLFLELDNLIYDDPNNWLQAFLEKEIAYMYDQELRCASGICFIKNPTILHYFMDYCKCYIETIDSTTFFMTEMQALFGFLKEYPTGVQLLPIHWPSTNVRMETYANYEKYGSIFDAAAIGIYLGGIDPFHTGGIVITGHKWSASIIDYTNYTFEWKEDNQGRLIPYVLHGDNWIQINNLHVHSKQLKALLSK
jgi:hypothetical protein